MTDFAAINKGEKALYDAMKQNKAYIAWNKESDAHERNRITNEVNGKNKDYRKSLSPGAAVYFDYLWKLADLYEKYGGVRPVWDMEELE